LLNGIGYTGCPLGRKNSDLPLNYAIGLSRLSAVLANELRQLITNLGAERVMFGTGMPFNYPDPAFVKLEVLDASEADKAKICWQNATTWLRLQHKTNGEEIKQCKERRII
jgi:predicted TIM-barrel fold metal-dependent hydrolase